MVFGAGLVALTPFAVYAVVTVFVCCGGSSRDQEVLDSVEVTESVDEDVEASESEAEEVMDDASVSVLVAVPEEEVVAVFSEV